ncbi:MAG: hypothetical protein IPK19_15445 [Chloroflexi bacterium]|nr:hypothetical protein [Chloroflexota bacterium]
MINEPGSNSLPGTSLQSRTLMELLQATFAIYRDNLVAYLILSAVVVIPITVISTLFGDSLLNAVTYVGDTPTFDPAFVNQICLFSIVVLVLTVVQTAILNCVVTHMTSEAQFGRKLTLVQAWNESSPLISKLVGANLIFFMVVFALAFASTLAISLCPLLVPIFAFTIYLSTAVNAFLAPVITLERTSATTSVVRSYYLGKSVFWRIFALSLSLALITLLFQLVIDAVVGLSGAAGSGAATSLGVSTLAGILVSIITTVLVPIAMTLLYYDARIRRENLLAELKSVGADARPLHVPVPPNMPPLINNQDIMNIVGLIVFVVVLMLFLGGTASALLNLLVPGLGGIPTG